MSERPIHHSPIHHGHIHHGHAARSRAQSARRESLYAPTVVTLLAATAVRLPAQDGLPVVVLLVLSILLLLGRPGVT